MSEVVTVVSVLLRKLIRTLQMRSIQAQQERRIVRRRQGWTGTGGASYIMGLAKKRSGRQQDIDPAVLKSSGIQANPATVRFKVSGYPRSALVRRYSYFSSFAGV